MTYIDTTVEAIRLRHATWLKKYERRYGHPPVEEWLTAASLTAYDRQILLEKWDHQHKRLRQLNTEIQRLYKKREKQTMRTKTLDLVDAKDAKCRVSDLRTFGAGDLFMLLSKASSDSEGWMKSAKAMEIVGVGCVVQVTTQQMGADGSYSVAEALTFVPGVMIVREDNCGPRYLKAF